MLTAADADLARRERAIPGLATVLDPDALVTMIRRVAPRADIRAARIQYVQYKRSAYCRVACQLEVAGHEVDIDLRACRPPDLTRWSENGGGSGAAGPLGPGRILVSERAVVVTVFPHDLKLHSLRDLTDAARRPSTLRALVPAHPALWPGEIRCLRYRPERRYVAEIRAPSGARALVKCYTDGAYARAKRNAEAFQSRGPLRIARLLGSWDHGRMLAFEWLPGRLVMDHCLASDVGDGAVTAAGAALAILHAQQPTGLDWWTRDNEVTELRALAAEIGFISPRLARLAAALVRRLAARLAASPAVRAPLHGDFSANQVLVHPSRTGIIDLDWACYGDPADDLGNFIAQAERIALRGELNPGRVEQLRVAFLHGYARAANDTLPPRIGLYTALELFRRARFPFRRREPDWPARTEALLHRAGDLLKHAA